MAVQTVREIQEALRLLSFYDPRLKPIAVDGVYSSQTSEAVRIFQALNGLDPTGDVDSATWEALRDNAAVRRSVLPSALNTFPHRDYVLHPNETNVTAAFIQLILQELSMFYDNIQEVGTSGVYDTQTVKEIQHIQRLHRLEVDGNVDIATWNVLATMFNNRFDSARR